MTKNIITILSVLVFCYSLSARELQVESFKLDSNDDSAVVNPRIDLNGDTCALIRVKVGIDDCPFDNVVGEVQRQNSIYFVYVP